MGSTCTCAKDQDVEQKIEESTKIDAVLPSIANSERYGMNNPDHCGNPIGIGIKSSWQFGDQAKRNVTNVMYVDGERCVVE